jgi:hypothetical protein
MAESAPKNFGADPLNLMRVMPPKEARVRCRTGDVGHAIFRAWPFCLTRMERMIFKPDICMPLYVIPTQLLAPARQNHLGKTTFSSSWGGTSQSYTDHTHS